MTTLQLNGHVERAHRTHTEEFYEVTNTGFEIVQLHQVLLEWEKVYNTVRPHQALGYLTPKNLLSSVEKIKNRVNNRNERAQGVLTFF